MEDYWLIYSDYDLSSYAVKTVYDNYYVVSSTILQYLIDQRIRFITLDRVNPKDVPVFVRQLDVGKRYEDSFTIFSFPGIRLVSQTKNTYRFRYKEYEIIVPKKLCQDLEQL
jgi:hypothetical protein